ncbi:hypothetical protein ILYODFUR_035239 [Ilyodon furcidens]|uniref:Uncharacterized protein n=1 Tax=Ilyodon furcidens TaxID=33524 RepID=A0ABV0U0R7_9TELE
MEVVKSRNTQKWGKYGKVRLRVWRQRLNCLPLPTRILPYMQFLQNQMDELQANVLFHEYRNACVGPNRNMAFKKVGYNRKKAKLIYKFKLEQDFKSDNLKTVWNGMASD